MSICGISCATYYCTSPPFFHSFETVRAENPDVLIVAAGARALIPDLPGLEKSQAVWAGDVLNGRVDVGDRVVVAGGGLVGCETALFLAQQDRKVVIVEMLDDVAVHMNPITKTPLILRLAEQGVEIKTGVKLEEIVDRKAMIIDKRWERYPIDADTVVMALGMEPRTEVVNELQGLAPEVYVIGDCVNARKLIDATREGFEVAVEI